MKKYLFSCLFILFILAGVAYSYVYKSQPALVSPVLGVAKTRMADNLWFPNEKKGEVFNNAPNITARSAFFIDTQTGEVLFEKNAHEKVSIASLTKIMTVIVALENLKYDDSVNITQKEADMEPDHMLLKVGEKLTVEELLDGIFLVSANDGAEALADNATGSREEFINLMNSKSAQLGMKDSKFINPTGLEEDDNSQYSTAYDVALMSRYAINRWPHLVDISSQPHIYLPETATHQDYDMFSGINLLTTYPGVVGFKTGFTPEAGLTLVTLARKGGHEVLGVILGSTDRRDDAKELLDYSFNKLTK